MKSRPEAEALKEDFISKITPFIENFNQRYPSDKYRMNLEIGIAYVFITLAFPSEYAVKGNDVNLSSRDLAQYAVNTGRVLLMESLASKTPEGTEALNAIKTACMLYQIPTGHGHEHEKS